MQNMIAAFATAAKLKELLLTNEADCLNYERNPAQLTKLKAATIPTRKFNILKRLNNASKHGKHAAKSTLFLTDIHFFLSAC